MSIGARFREFWPDEATRIARLAAPVGKSLVWLDSDVANEIDDPFAIAHAVLSRTRIDLAGISIAPHRRAGGVERGCIAASTALAEATLAHLGWQGPIVPGAEQFLESPERGVDSAAVDALVAFGMAHPGGMIVAIGAATNVASALLREPRLVGQVTVVWLGGHAPEVGSADEYNLQGDPIAARVLLESGVPIVQCPALGVTSHLFVSLAAMERDLEPHGGLGAFLTGLLREHHHDHFAYEKELWDVAATGWLVQPRDTVTVLEPTLRFRDDFLWVRDPQAPLSRRMTMVSRNAVLGDLFRKVRTHDLSREARR
ncbi:MAG: nucleoside hydrolase [Fimbriimonadaceae bacterium]|nr:nucleoside hydrolase [Fimbriimonadaceae bacterium]